MCIVFLSLIQKYTYMYIDARNTDDGSLIEGDICIIGAGAAGITMALEWMNTPYKVILLEGGGFEYDEKVQELYDGKTTGQRYYPLKSARLHYFGGTTNHWAGFCSTLDHIDFVKRDWVPHSGWPITRNDLDPYYARAHKYLDLGPYDYTLKYWQQKDPLLVPLVSDDSVIWNKMWQFSTPTNFGKKYKDTIIHAGNIHLYTYANVTDLTANENVSAIKEVTVKNYAGKEHKVRAKVFVLACCSIQNSRLLLASDKQAVKGLGNDNDLVGRNFMEHLEINSGELWLEKPNPLKLYGLNFMVTKARAELAISEKQQIDHKILNGTVSLTPLAMAKKMKPIIDIWTSNDPRKSLDSLMQNFQKVDEETAKHPHSSDNAYQLFTRIEQAPNPSSRVTLDTEKDSLGVPRATLHWELTALEKRSIRKIYELLGQAVGREGTGRVKMLDYLQDEKDTSWPSSTGGGWHHMGTTRMSDNPKEGVVDADCKVHDIANLYCAGSSCFATAGAPNPTLTLTALTIRLSDHLKQATKS
jgi:choline dehydrogenase-like flavoprotein